MSKNITKALLCILIICALFVAFSGCTTSPTASPTPGPKAAKIIGAQSGTTGEATAKALIGAANETRVKTFEHITDVFPALQSGQVDAIINDYPVSYRYSVSPQYNGKFKFVGEMFPNKEPLAIVVNKDNTELTKAMNDALAAVITDGTYDQLLKKYDLPKVEIALVTNPKNVTYDPKNYNFTTMTPGKLTIATEAAWEPFEWINSSDPDPQSKFVGFDMDLMRAMAKKMNYSVEFIDQPFSGIITSVQGKKFDAGISSFSVTPERQQQIDFTEPYYQIQQAILIRADDSSITSANDLK